MGSAEFEFGALPESLKRIRDNKNDYTYMDVPVKDKIVSIFCKNEDKPLIKKYIGKLLDDTVRLKEWSGFREFVNDNKQYKQYQNFDFWWDVVNDIMVWKRNTAFETKFKQLI